MTKDEAFRGMVYNGKIVCWNGLPPLFRWNSDILEKRIQISAGPNCRWEPVGHWIELWILSQYRDGWQEWKEGPLVSFEEATKALLEGKRVQLEDWEDERYWKLERYIRYCRAGIERSAFIGKKHLNGKWRILDETK